MKVSVIGFGNMGSAIVKSWINSGTFNASDISLFDADSGKLVQFLESESRSNQRVADIDISQNKEVIIDSDFILLAVKPQDLANIRDQYPIPDSSIIISILAGISLEKLGKQLDRTARLVRSMPNLAAMVGHSMTGYVVSADLTEQHSQQIEKLLTAFGSAHRLESEDMMDAWCALAGSGPGMVFDLMDKFSASAIELGFSPEMSQQITTQVFLGSSMLATERQRKLRLPQTCSEN